MGRALKYDIPGPDWRISEDEVREKGWDAIFRDDAQRPLRFVIEIGFGGGEFLTDRARHAPRTHHVGVEYSRKRVLKAARRLARTEIANVRLLLSTGERLVREFLPDASVETCWINFPDPWPKKRHHRRRLLQSGFVRDLARRLVPGGSVRVATDHAGYAEVVDAVLAGEAMLENAYAPEPFRREVADRLATRYELEWRAEGRPLYFWHYRRRRS
jgi:tRNA (guanine-N7-)-methyltransferase